MFRYSLNKPQINKLRKTLQDLYLQNPSNLRPRRDDIKIQQESNLEGEYHNIYSSGVDNNLFENLKVTWRGWDLDPKIQKISSNSNVLKSEICRKMYLPKISKLPTKRFLKEIMNNKPSSSASSNKRNKNTQRGSIVNRYAENFLNMKTADLVDFSGFVNSKKKRTFQVKGDNSTKRIWEFDKYTGLSNWGAFNNLNSRSRNLEYSKVYPKLGKIMINTSEDILGLHYHHNRNNMSNMRLYENDQDSAIEDFSCNRTTETSDMVVDLVIKHYGQDVLQIYDTYAQKPKQTINLKNIKQNERIGENFTETNLLQLENSNFNKPFSSQEKQIRRLTHRKTMILQTKFPPIHEKTSSENTEESSINSSNKNYQDLIRKSGDQKNVPICQYLEHDGRLIYYMDNYFNLKIFNEMSLKMSLDRKILKTDNYEGKFKSCI